MEEKKVKNLSTYIICMILTMMILIVIAAMADNRENQFQAQLQSQEQLNSSIQNQIVSLSEENYQLKTEKEQLEKNLLQKEGEMQFYKLALSVYTLYEERNYEEAENTLLECKKIANTEEQQEIIKRLDALLK